MNYTPLPIAAYTPQSEIEVIGLVLVVFLLPPILLYHFVVKRFFDTVKNRDIGFTRKKYILLLLGLGFAFSVLAAYGAQSYQDAQNIQIFALIVGTALLAKRIRNIGFSQWWVILALIPILNVWIGITALFCPPLIRRNKKHAEEDSRKESGSDVFRVAKSGSKAIEMEIAAIKLAILNKSLSKEDVYWDENLDDWIPLYCHPRIEGESRRDS